MIAKSAEEPKVSIILLCFNQRNYLQESIKSVLEQTYSNWELIISDNGSTDNSQDVIKEYVNDSRVKLLLYDSNEYLTKRFNQAFLESSGEFISILYGDDFYLPTKIEDQVNCFSKLSSEWGVVHSPGYNLNEFTKVKSEEKENDVHGDALKNILETFFTKGYINPISPLVRKECFEKYLSYEDLFTESECLYLKYALSYKFYFLDKPLVVMRQHDKNARWHSKRNTETLDECLERLKDYEEFPKNCAYPLLRLRAKNYSSGAWINLRLSEDIDKIWIRRRIYQAFKLDYKQIIKPKNTISLILTILPNFIRRGFNFILNLILGRETSIYFEHSFIKK